MTEMCGCDRKCATSVPWATSTCLALNIVAVAVFAVYGIDVAPLFNDISGMPICYTIIFALIGCSGFVDVCVLIVGVFSTGNTRHTKVRIDPISLCCKTSDIIVQCLVWLMVIAWLGVAMAAIGGILLLMVVAQSCTLVTYTDQTSCLTLQLGSVNLMNYCGTSAQTLCTSSANATTSCYICGGMAALALCSQVGFLMCLASNWVHLRWESKFTELWLKATLSATPLGRNFGNRVGPITAVEDTPTGTKAKAAWRRASRDPNLNPTVTLTGTDNRVYGYWQ